MREGVKGAGTDWFAAPGTPVLPALQEASAAQRRGRAAPVYKAEGMEPR